MFIYFLFPATAQALDEVKIGLILSVTISHILGKSATFVTK